MALSLALAMLGFQVSIGALNDLVDADHDRQAQPEKPIPAGIVAERTALGIALAGGALGLAISTGFGPLVLLLGAAGYGCGVSYDLVMRRLGWGWLCYAAAIPLLLAWTWVAAAGELPPAWPLLLPVAALAGPALHLANSLVDIEADARVGGRTLATRLGRERGRRTLAVLVAIIHSTAWLTLALSGPLSPWAGLAAFASTGMAVAALVLSSRSAATSREAGWLLQAIAMAGLAVAWTVSLAGR